MHPQFIVFLLFIGFLIFNEGECAMTQEQIDNMAKGFRKTCLSKVPVEPDVLDNLQKGVFTEDQNLKCYMRCVFKISKGIKGGKIDSNLLIAQFNLFPANNDRLIAGVRQCAPAVSSDDECDLVFQYAKCVYNFDPEVFFFP